MKSSLITRIVKFLLPIVAIVILFLIQPLAGIVAIVALLGYIVFRNLPTIYSFQGQAAYSKGDLDGAVRKFEKAYRTGRAKPTITVSYGYILLKLGRVDEAHAIFNSVIEKKLSQEDTLYAKANMALAIWKKGDIEGAVDMLEEVIVNYKNTTVYGSLGYLLLLKGDLDRALEFNLEAYDYNSSNTVILDNLGQTYHLLGENEKALKIYEKLMESNPTFPEAYYNYGLVLEALDEEERALEEIRKALNYKLTFLSTITREEIESKLNSLSPE